MLARLLGFDIVFIIAMREDWERMWDSDAEI